MFRPHLEALETRETPASAHPDLYLNVWINSGEVPAAMGGHTGNLIGIDFRPAAGDSRPIEEIAFVYHKIDLHTDGEMSLKGSKILENSAAAKDETITIHQNRTEANGSVDDLIGWDFQNNGNAAVRHRWLSIVDRTTLSDGYARAHALYQDVTIPAATGDGNVVYVGTAGGGVWKTADGGSSFYGSGVYKTVDAGQTW